MKTQITYGIPKSWLDGLIEERNKLLNLLPEKESIQTMSESEKLKFIVEFHSLSGYIESIIDKTK